MHKMGKHTTGVIVMIVFHLMNEIKVNLIYTTKISGFVVSAFVIFSL